MEGEKGTKKLVLFQPERLAWMYVCAWDFLPGTCVRRQRVKSRIFLSRDFAKSLPLSWCILSNCAQNTKQNSCLEKFFCIVLTGFLCLQEKLAPRPMLDLALFAPRHKVGAYANVGFGSVRT
jgi:hypothetical protein